MKQIGELLRGVLPEKPASATALDGICRSWSTVLGERAADAWPTRLTKDRRLIVNASSSVLSNELTYEAQSLVAALNELGCDLTGLRIVVGPVPRT